MLRILESQMAKLGARARRDYVVRMADYLDAAYRHRVAGRSRADLEAWVGAAVDKAESYGVTREAPVAQLMLLLLVLGDDADERIDWVGEILRDDRLVELGKLRRLVALARERAVPDIEEVTVIPEVCES